jgi:hypothetical protein
VRSDIGWRASGVAPGSPGRSRTAWTWTEGDAKIGSTVTFGSTGESRTAVIGRVEVERGEATGAWPDEIAPVGTLEPENEPQREAGSA